MYGVIEFIYHVIRVQFHSSFIDARFAPNHLLTECHSISYFCCLFCGDAVSNFHLYHVATAVSLANL